MIMRDVIRNKLEQKVWTRILNRNISDYYAILKLQSAMEDPINELVWGNVGRRVRDQLLVDSNARV